MEITIMELRLHVANNDKKFLDKVLLLANGMVKLHGYSKEKAIPLAINMATDWFNNNGQY